MKEIFLEIYGTQKLIVSDKKWFQSKYTLVKKTLSSLIYNIFLITDKVSMSMEQRLGYKNSKIINPKKYSIVNSFIFIVFAFIPLFIFIFI
jgi:hypothetical protein